MSHRRPEPRQAGLERALRYALRVAADSVEPAGGGLDRIRAKIAVGQPALRTRWWTTPLARVLAVAGLVWGYLEIAAFWLRYGAGIVVERFRPELGRGGWVRWLRPAAGLATVLLVVTGVSWAATGLPLSPFTTTGNQRQYGGGGHSSSRPGDTDHSTNSYVSPGSSRPAKSSPTPTSASCPTSSPPPITSVSASPPQSSSPSPPASSSPTPPPSSSPPTSTPPTGSPSPSSTSPSTTVPTAGPGSAQAAPGSGSSGAQHLAAAQRPAAAPGTQSTPKMAATPAPPRHRIAQRCV